MSSRSSADFDLHECKVSAQGHVYVKAEVRSKLGIEPDTAVYLLEHKGWLYLLRKGDLARALRKELP